MATNMSTIYLFHLDLSFPLILANTRAKELYLSGKNNTIRR